MKKIDRVMSILPAVLLLLTLSTDAVGWDDRIQTDETINKYLKVNDKNGTDGLKDEKIKTLCQENQDLLSSPLGQAALQGKGDADLKDAWKGLLYWVHWDERWAFPMMSMPNSCSMIGWDAFYGPVLWETEGADTMLGAMIDSNEKLTKLACLQKQHIYRALWWLGAYSQADVMIAGFKNDECTEAHIVETLAVLHTWPLTDKQIEAVEGVCLGFFQSTDSGSKIKNERIACMRFLGNVKSDNDELREYMENFLTDSKYRPYAARSLGQIGHAGSKESLQYITNGAKATKNIENKKGKMVEVEYVKSQEDTVAAAIALIGMNDKNASNAVAYWLTVDVDGKRFQDSGGFERVLWNAPFASDAGMKKLKPMLDKAWKDVTKLAKDDTYGQTMKLNMAIGFAQMGDARGLKDIENAIKGPDANHREDALEAMGCRFDYNSYKSSMGGFDVGDGGISKADAQKLIDAILKKVKFWTNKTDKEDAAMAVLNMRARVKAAGL